MGEKEIGGKLLDTAKECIPSTKKQWLGTGVIGALTFAVGFGIAKLSNLKKPAAETKAE